MSEEISGALGLVNWIAIDQQNILDTFIPEYFVQVEEGIARMHNQQLYLFVSQHACKHGRSDLHQFSIGLFSIKILLAIGFIFLETLGMTDQIDNRVLISGLEATGVESVQCDVHFLSALLECGANLANVALAPDLPFAVGFDFGVVQGR